MIMLSLEGWLDGLSSVAVLFCSSIFGLYCIYESKKNKIKPLFHLGIAAISLGLMWLGSVCDFFVILITGNNWSIFVLSFMWLPLLVLFLNNLGIEFIFPRRKFITILILGLLSVLYELFLFLDTNSFIAVYPEISGEELIDHGINIISIAGILYLLLPAWALFLVYGFIHQSIQSIGILRKKFSLISFGCLIVLICGVVDGVATLGFVLVFIRVLLLIGVLLVYLGLKEESIEPKEKPKKEIKIEGGLIRLTKRPDQITEEEVLFHKEKKICLVCKGKATGFNIYVCPKCDVSYCQNCARELTKLENACWVCDSPFDKSKPSKRIQEEEDLVKLPEGKKND